MSDKTIRALECIRDHDVDCGRTFARLLWPDSDGWLHSLNTGNGSVRGRGMCLSGGSFLGRLCKAGLVRKSAALEKFVLTDAGIAAILAAPVTPPPGGKEG